jgi:TonB family protein
MNTGLILDNLVSYNLQVGMLVVLAACVPALLRLRQPRVRLAYWYMVLAACLLLPLVQPWKPAVISGLVEITTVAIAVQPAAPVQRFSMPRSEIALLVLAGGVLIRLLWLSAGFWKLRRYRRRSQPLEPAPAWGVEASLRLSADVPSPVTFGWRKPVVMLPECFPALGASVQDAILCHEVLHVRRRDWLFTMFEELVRAAFWFHPAIWWLLGEIGLAREQEVDRLAIEITQQREEYMDALLAIAGAHAEPDLAPAPLFLRRRHLKQRVVLILLEARMSKARIISAFTASVAVLAAACWLVTGTFPLMAAPQVVNDAPGVTIGLGGASLLHRAPVEYPPAALRAGVQGTVSVEVRTDAKGNVSDARVVSGPDELRKAALQSVLQWHFAADSAGASREVQITFELPKAQEKTFGDATVAITVPSGTIGGVPGGVAAGVSTSGTRGTLGTAQTGLASPTQITVQNQMRQQALDEAGRLAQTPRPIKSITVMGLSDQAAKELVSHLPVREGDLYSPENLQSITQAAKDFDEHLSTTVRNSADGVTIQIVAPGAQPAVQRIKVGGNVQTAMVLTKVTPAYPQLAKQARVEGVVQLAVIIAQDGTVQEIHSLGGPPLLIAAAVDAVRQWVYRPTLLNGQPVQVETTVDINFTLNQ